MKIDFNIITRQLTRTAFLATTLYWSIDAFAAAPLEGFTSICTLDENCAVEDSTLVAFGSGQHYIYKTISGNFLCSPNTFGEKLQNVAPNPTCLTLDKETTLSTLSNSIQLGLSTPIPTGKYAIISVYSGKALTIKESDLNDGGALVQKNFEQSANQIWDVKIIEKGVYSLTAIHSQKVLENQDWNHTDGVKLQQYSWINSTNQHWIIKRAGNNSYQINSRLNGHSIDLLEMNRRENGDVCLWTYWGGSNQHWKFIPITQDTNKSE